MLRFDDDKIREAIGVLCNEFERKGIRQNIHIIIVGAASLILKFGLVRATSDIDILEKISVGQNVFGGLGNLLSRMGFHIVSEAMMNLHPDYSERLELYAQKGQIHVLTLHPYDLAISKIGRGFGKDMEDIINSDLLSLIDIEKLKALYFEAVAYWIGDEKKYETNWDLFFNDYFGRRKSDESETEISEQISFSDSSFR